MDLCRNGSIHSNHDCSSSENNQSRYCARQPNCKRRGWRNKHLCAEVSRKNTQMDGMTREEQNHRVRVIHTRLGCQSWQHIPCCAKKHCGKVLTWKYAFQMLVRGTAFSSTAAMAKGRRDNFGLLWSSSVVSVCRLRGV